MTFDISSSLQVAPHGSRRCGVFNEDAAHDAPCKICLGLAAAAYLATTTRAGRITEPFKA